MNQKIVYDPVNRRYYSYYDLLTLKGQAILKSINKNKDNDNKDNALYCMCNGPDINKAVKMMTKSHNEDSFYHLSKYPSCKNTHHKNCPKHSIEKDILSINRPIDTVRNELELDIFNKSSKPHGDSNPTLFALGEFLLLQTHNDFIDTYNRMCTNKAGLSELFEFYNPYCDGSKINPLSKFKIKNALGIDIYVKDIIFNPVWIKCDSFKNKNASIVKNHKIINNRHADSNNSSKQYILLKYISYQYIGSNKVKLTLETFGRKLKSDHIKNVTICADKDYFFKMLNKVKINLTEIDKVDYYLSALVDVYNGEIIATDLAFIPTYRNYLIPVRTSSEVKWLNNMFIFRSKVFIKRIPKLASSFNLKPYSNLKIGNLRPDFIIFNKSTKVTALVEFFEVCTHSYYNQMVDRTIEYEKVCNCDELVFIGCYYNLGWKSAPINKFINGELKNIYNLTDKVKNSIKKMLE